jgi:hypothetical protein
LRRAGGHKRCEAIAAARRAYWARWRAGEVVNQRCPGNGATLPRPAVDKP